MADAPRPAADESALPTVVRDAGAADDTVVSPAAVDTLPRPAAAGGSGDPRAAAARARSRAPSLGDELRGASIERFAEDGDRRYELLGELARGALGRILRARDRRTGRVVALKEVLRPDDDLIARFAREALVTANLQHPAIVPVYEVGRWSSGEPFYAMKLVRGRTLDALIALARTSAARVALVPHVLAIADALAYAHGERVIHRDLKPANVLIGPYGETVVIDWGLARHLSDPDEPAAPTADVAGPGETVLGAVVGTPTYMAPEQAAGQPLDERADVYAIGALLYHVLAGVRPYAELTATPLSSADDTHDGSVVSDEVSTVERVLAAAITHPPRPLAELAPEVAPELIAIADKAMARDRDARYPSARELALDLRRFQAGQLVGAHRYSSRELVRRWLRRHRAAVAIAAAAIVALAVFATISVRRIARERDRAQAQTAVATRERADARAARTFAERRLADSLEVQARQAMLAGAPERALPLLAGALAVTPDPSPPLAILTGQAWAAYDGLEAVTPVDERGTTGADLADGGRLLVTTSATDRLRAWELRTRTVRWTVDAIARAAVSPDGATVLAAGDDGAVQLVAAADGHALARWQPPAGWQPDERAARLAWAPAGDRFAIGTTGGRLLLGSPGADTLVAGEPTAGAARAVAFAPGGGALAIIDGAGALTVRDPATGALRARLDDGAAALACAWRDDDTLVSADDDRSARVWRVGDRAVVRRLPHERALRGVLIAGARVVTFGDGDRAWLWPLDGDGAPIALGGHRLAIAHAALAGDRLVTADRTGGLAVWDVTTGERAAALPGQPGLAGLTARGDRVIAFGDERPLVWRLGDDRPARRLHPGLGAIDALAFDAGGASLWLTAGGASHLVDVATGAARAPGAGLTPPPPTPAGASTTAARAEPGTHTGAGAIERLPVLASGDARGEVVLRHRDTGAIVRRWFSDAGPIAALAFRPTGRILATAAGGHAQLWDAASGDLLATSPDAGAPLAALAWSPDGRTLAFAGGSGTLWVWSVPADGPEVERVIECVSPLRANDSALTAATFDAAWCAASRPR